MYFHKIGANLRIEDVLLFELIFPTNRPRIGYSTIPDETAGAGFDVVRSNKQSALEYLRSRVGLS